MADKKEEQVQQLINESFIGSFLKDENITDIKYNATELRLKHNLKGSFLAPTQPTEEEVAQLVRRIADIQMKEFTDTEVILDTQIGNLRVNAVHPAGSDFGTCMALRVSRPKKVMNSLSEVSNNEVEQLIKVLIKADISMIISGITGAGKTEVQKMIVDFIDDHKTITLIEDTRDSHIKSLYPNKDVWSYHTLTGEDRTKKFTGTDFIKAGLRNDSDWIIISETRGSEEAYEMIQAALTGHSMLTTLHSPGAAQIPNRLLNMVGQQYRINELLFGKDIVDRLPIGIHMTVDYEESQIKRYMSELVEFIDFNEKGVVTNTVYQVKNTYIGGDEYKTEKIMSPLSEKTLTVLKNKKLFHDLPDIFKKEKGVGLRDVKAI